MSRPALRPLAFLFFAPLLAGCGGGDELPRRAVSGTVTLDGQPLAEGTIRFDPADGQATGGGDVIRGGSYSLPRANGLVPGQYRVSISSASGASGASGEAPGSAGVMMSEQIPSRYNSRSELTAEVADSGSNTFDLDLELDP
jgi:hypothetical protein